jgi:hypothetical protein
MKSVESSFALKSLLAVGLVVATTWFADAQDPFHPPNSSLALTNPSQGSAGAAPARPTPIRNFVRRITGRGGQPNSPPRRPLLSGMRSLKNKLVPGQQ